MSQQAIELLIKSHPLWFQIDQTQIPVHVKTIYTVLGRRMNRWHTILKKTDDVHTARRTMDAANGSGLFDRIVIAEGRSANDAPAERWETIECAVPRTALVTGLSFTNLLNDLQKKTANVNPDAKTTATPITGEKQSFTFMLASACLFAALNASVPGLALVAVLAFFETVFLNDTRPISASRARDLNTMRNWSYALLNGTFLLPLVLQFFR